MEVHIRFKHASSRVSEPLRVRYDSLPQIGGHILWVNDMGDHFFNINEETSVEDEILFSEESYKTPLLSHYEALQSARNDGNEELWNMECQTFNALLIKSHSLELPKYCKVNDIYYELYEVDEDDNYNDYAEIIPVIILEKDEEWYEQHK